MTDSRPPQKRGPGRPRVHPKRDHGPVQPAPPEDLPRDFVTLGGRQRIDPRLVPDWKEWPTLTGVAAILQTDSARVQQLQIRGELGRYEAPDGTYRFNPEHVAAYQSFADQTEPAKLSFDPEIVKEAQQQAIAGLKQAYEHNQKMFGLYSGPLEKLVDAFQKEAKRKDDEAKRKDERIVYLEAELQRVQNLREEMLNQQLERQLAREHFAATERRKDQAFGKFMDVMPGLWESIEATILTRGTELGPVAKDVVSLLKSLDPEVLAGLLELEGVLDDEQKATIRRILSSVKRPIGSGLNGSKPQAEQATNQESVDAKC